MLANAEVTNLCLCNLSSLLFLLHDAACTRRSPVLKDDAPLFMSQRKDLDNLVKFVLDSLNGAAYEDDAQVRGWKLALGNQHFSMLLDWRRIMLLRIM